MARLPDPKVGLVIRIPLLSLLLLIAASAIAERKPPPAPDYAESDRAVLAASLQVTCDYWNEHNKGAFEVLESQTAQTKKLSFPTDLSADYSEALSNLLERNAARHPLPAGVACSAIKIVDPETIDATFGSGAKPPSWDGFYAKYPGAAGRGSITLPGYSQKRDHAAVYRVGACGSQCASGSLQLLRKVGKTWTFEESITLWIS